MNFEGALREYMIPETRITEHPGEVALMTAPWCFHRNPHPACTSKSQFRCCLHVCTCRLAAALSDGRGLVSPL